MKTFLIPCTWQMYGTLVIKAESLEEAIKYALNPEIGLPDDRDYVEGSFRLEDKDVIEEVNQHETGD